MSWKYWLPLTAYWALSSRARAKPFCPTKSWVRSKKVVLLPLRLPLPPLLLPLLHLPLLLATKTPSALRLLASWPKRTASS
ncbi:hypothetical protein D3C72_2095260 [compost metagenome]